MVGDVVIILRRYSIRRRNFDSLYHEENFMVLDIDENKFF